MKTLEQVMDEHPTLNFQGYRRSTLARTSLEVEREALARSVEGIQAALYYLEGLPTVKKTSRRARDSYELKHKAERTDVAMRVAHGYISNGCLIAAAYMLELDVKPTGINAIIGVGWGPGER